MESNEEKILEIRITGKNGEQWQDLRGKFISAITKLMDTMVNEEQNTTVKDEIKELTSALLDHAKSRLNKAGIENEKTLAEIENLFVLKAKGIAEARKTNAEAKSIEIDNTIKSLKIAIAAMKFVSFGEKGEENLLFLSQMESVFAILSSIQD